MGPSAPGGYLEHRGGKVGREYFRLAHRLHTGLEGAAPEFVANAGRHPPCTAFALGGHIKADAYGLKAPQARAGIENAPSAKPGINYGAYSLYGKGSLGHGSSENYLAGAGSGRSYSSFLKIVGQHAVKRIHLSITGLRAQRLGAAAYLALSGEERQYVAALLRMCLADGRGDSFHDVFGSGF